jgi:hypothetical protein
MPFFICVCKILFMKTPVLVTSGMSAFPVHINVRKKPNVQSDKTKMQFDLHVNSNNYT